MASDCRKRNQASNNKPWKSVFLECSKPKSFFENPKPLCSSFSNPSAYSHINFCFKIFVIEKSAPGKNKDLSLICTLQLVSDYLAALVCSRVFVKKLVACYMPLNNIFYSRQKNAMSFSFKTDGKICWKYATSFLH